MLSHQVVVQPRAVRGPNGDDRGPGAHDHHLGLQRPLAPGKTAFIPFRVFPGPGVPLGRLAAPRGSSTQVGLVMEVVRGSPSRGHGRGPVDLK